MNNLFPQRDEIAKLRAELATAKERIAELEDRHSRDRHAISERDGSRKQCAHMRVRCEALENELLQLRTALAIATKTKEEEAGLCPAELQHVRPRSR